MTDVNCPIHDVGKEFDPFSDAYQEDPYVYFAHAREHEPVFFSEALGAYVVTRCEDCAAVLRDPETFSASEVLEFVTPLSDRSQEILREAGFVPGPVTVNEDDPEHRPHRDLLRKAFSSERLALDRLCDDPGDSFLSELIADAKDPANAQVLDRIYVYRMCMNILFAGHETTSNASANAFRRLLEHRDQ